MIQVVLGKIKEDNSWKPLEDKDLSRTFHLISIDYLVYNIRLFTWSAYNRPKRCYWSRRYAISFTEKYRVRESIRNSGKWLVTSHNKNRFYEQFFLLRLIIVELHMEYNPLHHRLFLAVFLLNHHTVFYETCYLFHNKAVHSLIYD